jgi:hypothetical protein
MNLGHEQSLMSQVCGGTQDIRSLIIMNSKPSHLP